MRQPPFVAFSNQKEESLHTICLNVLVTSSILSYSKRMNSQLVCQDRCFEKGKHFKWTESLVSQSNTFKIQVYTDDVASAILGRSVAICSSHFSFIATTIMLRLCSHNMSSHLLNKEKFLQIGRAYPKPLWGDLDHQSHQMSSTSHSVLEQGPSLSHPCPLTNWKLRFCTKCGYTTTASA